MARGREPDCGFKNCKLQIANCELNDHGEKSVVGEYGEDDGTKERQEQGPREDDTPYFTRHSR